MTVNTDCTTAIAPVHGVVEFVPADFKAAFPQFASVPDGDLTTYFALATMVVDNTCASRISDATQRERLLNLLVAHIATLQPVSPNGGAGAGSSMVGRIASATEGSVSASAEYAAEVSQSMAWFIQTQYGAMFWQLTSPARSFMYVAPSRPCGPAGAYPGRRGY